MAETIQHSALACICTHMFIVIDCSCVRFFTCLCVIARAFALVSVSMCTCAIMFNARRMVVRVSSTKAVHTLLRIDA